jgi:hypothetical protein
MLEMFQMYVANVLDVAKVDRDIAYVAMVYTYVASVCS